MPRRDGAVHVATTRRHYKGKTYQSHLLRRTYRDGGKVKHETLGNISHLPLPIIEMIRGALKGEAYIPSSESFEILRSLPHGHVAAVLGTLRKIGLEDLIGSRRSGKRDLVVAMLTARVIDPRSKLATARSLNNETAWSTLGEILEVEDAAEDDLYEAMDWLLSRQKRMEEKLAKKHLQEGSLVLYDVTSSYYTGSHCSLAKIGHNRDGKKRFAQVVVGLLCNGEGCPVSVEVFEGNAGDPTTLSSQIEKVRERFGLKRVVLVGDRGLITEARLKEEIRPVKGLDWISALRGPAIRKLMDEKVIQPTLFDERDMAEVRSPEYPGERLIVCFNPLLAEERARKREDLLQATEKELEKIAVATRRKQRPLKGKEKIGLRVGKVINRYKVGKHFTIKITKTGFSYERDASKIVREAALDGIYVIRTSVPKSRMDAEETVRTYKDLSKVEQAFRSLKTVDLMIRPIYHRLPDRVRAHAFLCMLAYYVLWHMRLALAPLLFDDEDKEMARKLTDSVVAPARRSPRAERKARRKRTEEGDPVHSFRTLLKDLSTIAKNRVRPKPPRGSKIASAPFDIITTPTPHQRRAFELLGLSISM